MKDLELRMYGLVPYNISPIQQGIQYGHAIVEYGQMMKHLDEQVFNTQYNNWADNWKTFMILNGGTSNHSKNRYSESEELFGTMETNLTLLEDNDIKLATFYEPDLNDMLSAIVFIVDERVFNRKDYPDFIDWIQMEYPDLYPSNIDDMKFSEVESDRNIYNIWVDLIGGERNVFLKGFLKNFRLA